MNITKHVATCDKCGAVSFIKPEHIPERDADLDDTEHDDRSALGNCGLVRESHRGEEWSCEGLVWYLGDITLALSSPDRGSK